VNLITQPDDGLSPLLKAIQRAKKSIDVVIFRFDRIELEKALAAAVTRGVAVRTLVAYTNGGGEKRLRKLERTMLEAGVTVTRTADDLPRYHGKMTIVDDTLFVLGFNYTRLDIERSRSFGLVTRDKKLLHEARALFEADSTRQPFTPGDSRLVVSPENSRKRLSEFIDKARKKLVIYDERITDKLMLRLLRERVAAGVDIRVIGKIDKKIDGVSTCSLPDLRLHVRAIVRDGNSVFVGSQSLRKPELDARREIGIIVNDARLAKRIESVFEADWKLTKKDDAKPADEKTAEGAATQSAQAAGA
jgi:phosphatidylserine/phosphatidylglycerophosphate/cardiolipin synthase-like enzyme